jgi:DNA-binding XRE family transcriptional regulator
MQNVDLNMFQVIEINEHGAFRLIPEGILKSLISNQKSMELPEITREANVSLGQTIRNYREKSKLKQKEAASKIEVTPASMNRIEKNIHKPRKETLEKLCKLFGEEFKELMINMGQL